MKKILMALVLLFSIPMSGFASSQDSIAKKVHFGCQGNMNFYYDIYINNYPQLIITEKELVYEPSINFFLNRKRFFFHLGLSDFYKKKTIQKDTLVDVYNYYLLGLKTQFVYLFLNPEKHFIAPYLGWSFEYAFSMNRLGKNTTGTIPEEYKWRNYFSRGLSIGVQRNINKNIFLRIATSINRNYSKYGSNTFLGFQMSLASNFK